MNWRRIGTKREAETVREREDREDRESMRLPTREWVAIFLGTLLLGLLAYACVFLTFSVPE